MKKKLRRPLLPGGRSLDRGVGIAPTTERLAKTRVVRLDRAIADTAGAIGRPWQSQSLLAGMAGRGTITPKMQAAGERFHAVFRHASLDDLCASDPRRVVAAQMFGAWLWNPGGGSEAARRQVLVALDALGGVQSPGGSCAWHVLGCEMSLRSWASTATWATGRIDHKMAAGILVVDLGILQAHWGL